MLKYFIKETNEEIVFGDVVELTLSKELEDGVVDRTVEMEFTEANLDFLIDSNIIERRGTLDFCDSSESICPFEKLMDEILKKQKVLEGTLTDIDQSIENISRYVSKLSDSLMASKCKNNE